MGKRAKRVFYLNCSRNLGFWVQTARDNGRAGATKNTLPAVAVCREDDGEEGGTAVGKLSALYTRVSIFYLPRRHVEMREDPPRCHQCEVRQIFQYSSPWGYLDNQDFKKQ